MLCKNKAMNHKNECVMRKVSPLHVFVGYVKSFSLSLWIWRASWWENDCLGVWAGPFPKLNNSMIQMLLENQPENTSAPPEQISYDSQVGYHMLRWNHNCGVWISEKDWKWDTNRHQFYLSESLFLTPSWHRVVLYLNLWFFSPRTPVNQGRNRKGQKCSQNLDSDQWHLL